MNIVAQSKTNLVIELSGTIRRLFQGVISLALGESGAFIYARMTSTGCAAAVDHATRRAQECRLAYERKTAASGDVDQG